MGIQHWRIRDRYYRLMGNRCEKCGAEFFPPVYRCKKCGSEKLVDADMPRTGKILTYTQLHEPLPGFEDQSPMFIALVELENGTRVVGQVVDSPDDSVRTGAKAKAVFRRVQVDGDSGQILYGYKFVIAS
ncbi:MAG TPA: Zn-ribbon domain-containing OB-fold protein [Nitrososphaerales archaeon]|nr:Zn-ribbon domain-containing OB-fold protein [Nitrososphaerales archaeon]